MRTGIFVVGKVAVYNRRLGRCFAVEQFLHRVSIGFVLRFSAPDCGHIFVSRDRSSARHRDVPGLVGLSDNFCARQVFARPMLEIALSKNAGLRRVVIIADRLSGLTNDCKSRTTRRRRNCIRLQPHRRQRVAARGHKIQTQNNRFNQGNGQGRQRIVIPTSLEIVKMLRR